MWLLNINNFSVTIVIEKGELENQAGLKGVQTRFLKNRSAAVPKSDKLKLNEKLSNK
jgi:hypothetical protein